MERELNYLQDVLTIKFDIYVFEKVYFNHRNCTQQLLLKNSIKLHILHRNRKQLNPCLSILLTSPQQLIITPQKLKKKGTDQVEDKKVNSD